MVVENNALADIEWVQKFLVQNDADDIRSFSFIGSRAPYDCALVSSTKSPLHSKAIASKLGAELKARRLKFDVDAGSDGHWVVVGFGGCVVHMFWGQAREDYDMDGLYDRLGAQNERQ